MTGSMRVGVVRAAERDRPALRVHPGADVGAGLAMLHRAITSAPSS
jgi:hypothetical protein